MLLSAMKHFYLLLRQRIYDPIIRQIKQIFPTNYKQILILCSVRNLRSDQTVLSICFQMLTFPVLSNPKTSKSIKSQVKERVKNKTIFIGKRILGLLMFL